MDSENKIYKKVKTYSFKSDYEGLINNKEYFNITVGIILTNEGLYDRTKTLLEETKEILNIISRELAMQ